MAEAYRQQMIAVFEDIDVLVTPTCPIVAPAIEARTITADGIEEAVGNALTRFTTFFNLTGNPALSTPCGLHSSGLPIGLQIVGRCFDETTILRIGHALEATGEFAVPPPPLEPSN